MKRLFLILCIFSSFATFAQHKVKESEVPKDVLLALENTYFNYKVKGWYQEANQYIADLVVDGQAGKSYFTDKGDWQYSAFPVSEKESPTLMMNYFYNNYPGYRSKKIDYIEEKSGDNYYRMIVTKKGIGSSEYEMVFDTRGKLLKSNAPDPELVKKEYLALNNPEDYDNSRTTPVAPTGVAGEGEKGSKKSKKDLEIEAEENNPDKPTEEVLKVFDRKVPATRIEKGPEWIKEGSNYIARYLNKQKITTQMTLSENAQVISTMTELAEERYPVAVKKYLDTKYKDEKYKIEKICRIDYDAKYKDPQTGTRPKSSYYVMISQKVKGKKEKKITRMTFDQSFRFTGVLAEPLDRFDKLEK